MSLNAETFAAISKAIEQHGLCTYDIAPELPHDAENRRLVQGFQDIHEFYKTHSVLPQSNKMSERKLFSRLKSLAANKEKSELLAEYDTAGILELARGEYQIEIAQAEEKIEIPDTLSEDVKGFAKSSAFQTIMQGKTNTGGLFGGKFAEKKQKDQTMPDYIAQRKVCEDFDSVFLPLFVKCQQEIKNGSRKLVKFKREQHIEKGKYYVLNGLICYVAEKGEAFQRKNKTNHRLRLIFVNGKESDMLLRSLSTELYKSGYMITELESEVLPGMKMEHDDAITGWIYVLASLSKDPHVQAIPNLHKIGFSTKPVEQRIANAEKETTYLRAPVKIITTYKCANLNTHALEQILHVVFANARMDIEVTDKSGNTHKSTEWFTVPLKVIQEAMVYIMNDSIEHYTYDTKDEILKLN